jgi:hypothetical protein
MMDKVKRKVPRPTARINRDETVKTRSFRLGDQHMRKIERLAERRNLNNTEVLRRMVEAYKG